MLRIFMLMFMVACIILLVYGIFHYLSNVENKKNNYKTLKEKREAKKKLKELKKEKKKKRSYFQFFKYYFNINRIRIRKELDKVFKEGLRIGEKTIVPIQENCDNTKINFTEYYIEFPNGSKITIKQIQEGKNKNSFIILKSEENTITEKISNYKANKYIKCFKSETDDVKNVKRTVEDIIRESQRIRYNKKLEEIKTFKEEL